MPTTLYTEQSKNIRKTWILMSLFFGIVIAIGWVFAQIYANPGILYFAVFFSIVMNVASYWFSDKIVLALHRAKIVDFKENSELYRVLENLTITAGLPMPKFYIMEDPSPNAFATGRDPKHAVVVVTTGLLGTLDRSELEGVLAHELSHIGNRDMLVSTVAVVLVGFIAILSDMFLRSSRFARIGGNNRDGRAGGILIILGILLAILAPIIASLIQLAISRRREFLADASGALLTRYPDGLASALNKISAYSQPLRTATNATAHLFLHNPFGADRNQDKTPWLVKIFSTHPPIEERIKALKDRAIR
ncbi:MAG: Protease HtpX-like protein [Parcubacteria group bacterium GW2011_GWB1_52_7]|nr:MAG: Protease HtpX-like protein [Parcubacteria group bacterium GW2011_GWA1_51_12]KKW28764.1 MAG: Protease HtpX-like protein [Parcubacteria group bacterium GW2011_GWB1_52_7]KKW30075.1 MAG: Protease HtpX-like protein [Parcubacteria group bacterium GW2011_GWC2_52_8c]